MNSHLMKDPGWRDIAKSAQQGRQALQRTIEEIKPDHITHPQRRNHHTSSSGNQGSPKSCILLIFIIFRVVFMTES